MGVSIKEAAKRVSMTPHTLRYYENEGLMPYLKRDEQGNRQFCESDIQWLKFVKCLRETGMSIREMRHFVDLSQQGDVSVPQRLDILYNHKKELENKLLEMEVYLSNINHKIEYYETMEIKKTS